MLVRARPGPPSGGWCCSCPSRGTVRQTNNTKIVQALGRVCVIEMLNNAWCRRPHTFLKFVGCNLGYRPRPDIIFMQLLMFLICFTFSWTTWGSGQPSSWWVGGWMGGWVGGWMWGGAKQRRASRRVWSPAAHVRKQTLVVRSQFGSSKSSDCLVLGLRRWSSPSRPGAAPSAVHGRIPARTSSAASLLRDRTSC